MEKHIVPQYLLRKRLMLTVMCVLSSTLARADEPIRVRILSYNIHHAEGVDKKLDVERIAKVILSVKPDIVALQEVDQNATRSLSVDQPAELARLCSMNVEFGANIPLQGGHYGNVILSRFPINQHSKVSDDSESVVFFATHLDHRRDDRERVASARGINKLASVYGNRSMFLAGDLNDVIGSPTLDEFDAEWTRTNATPLPTIPVTAPQRQIDFVLYRPANRWKVIEVKVLDEVVASDHRGILAVLELSRRAD
jgi:endonuclease/exonuclease/phosphatase family metal-dependent hydrolase